MYSQLRDRNYAHIFKPPYLVNNLLVAVLWEHSPLEGDHYESLFFSKRKLVHQCFKIWYLEYFVLRELWFIFLKIKYFL